PTSSSLIARGRARASSSFRPVASAAARSIGRSTASTRSAGERNAPMSASPRTIAARSSPWGCRRSFVVSLMFGFPLLPPAGHWPRRKQRAPKRTLLPSQVRQVLLHPREAGHEPVLELQRLTVEVPPDAGDVVGEVELSRLQHGLKMKPADAID